MKLLKQIGLSFLLVAATVVRAEDPAPFQMIVMDPLAAPLSCPCVEGYAQREYEVLAAHLEKRLDRPVKLVFSETLIKALKATGGKVDLIIGKDSVVRADAAEQNVQVKSVASLTGMKGSTTQRGLIVVNRDDPAITVADLESYRVIFGPRECDEKHSAAIKLLKSHGISIPKELEIDQACSDGAAKVVELGPNAKVAAVISSYAAPLLEGCGTIKKGDLRVIGKTDPVPFVTAFLAEAVSKQDQQIVTKALMSTNQSPALLEALESLVGFLPAGLDADRSKKNSS